MSLNQEYDHLFKILIIGNSCVGKSNILLRFSEDLFHESFLPTIGVDFKIRNLEIDNSTIKLHIWDTAGQERFKTITSTYYKGVQGIVLVYDITDKTSFQDIENWLNEIQQHASPNTTKILVGNKCDLADKRQVSFQEGQSFAESLGVQFLETSAKNKIGIDDVFTKLTKSIMATVPKKPQGGNNGGVNLVAGNKKKKDGKKSGGCC